MPRSSRHKSSKHSSRDARDYSDSEKDSNLKERKGREESSSRVSKDLDKRKLDSKEHTVEYVSSKRRKERAVDDGVSDRWNGGEEVRGEVSRKSKSKRKEESEGKHKESSRKERESGGERDRESKGKSDRLVASEEEQNNKQLREITESNTVHAEPDNQLERRNRRRRDDAGDGDKHLDDVGDAKDRRLFSKDDISKDGKLKDEKRKDERYRDKYREDPNWDSKGQDEHLTKDLTSSKSDEKHLKDEKDMTENQQKKSKSQDRDREHKTDRERDKVRDRYHDHERESERDRERGKDRNHNRDHDWDQDRDRERGRDRERNRDRDRETDRERERDYDHDGSYLDDRSARYKDSRRRERSPDDRDDYNDSKSKATKGHISDMEKKPLSNSRVESEADRGRSQSRQVPVDSSSKRRRISPSSGSHVGTDEYRYFKSEESKYRDSVAEQRSKANSSREVNDLSRGPERSSKYRSTDKSNDVDDGHPGELSIERSSSSKPSPMGLVERSPSSTSIEHRQINRSSLRRGLDSEEPGRRSSGSFEDRLNWDAPLEKPSGEDPSPGDSSVYNRTGQGNSSSIPPLPGFRAGADSPSYMSSLEDENRYNSVSRYKRSGDHNSARGHGNAWRGGPNWSSPMPNGFMPFQHGPPLGGFQSMMPQFPPPPLFGVRPSMEINHAGIPYHIPGTGHLRPLGWQNMMDGSGPSHMHVWDGNNGVFRDEPHMYGAHDWDQSRHPMNRRSWEASAETWKGQNGDVNRDTLSASQKEDHPVYGMDDDFSADGQVGEKSQQKRNHVDVHAKDVETSPDYTSAIKSSETQHKAIKEKMFDSSEKSSYNDIAQLSRAYLSKLDVSKDLANQELYIQCVSLLDLEEEEEEAAIVEDITMRVNLHGGRASSKTSLALHRPSPFPASNEAVFQRAMDLYKKQCVDSRGAPIVRTILNDDAATNLEKRDDHIPNHSEGKEDEQLLTSNVEQTDALVSTSDQQPAEVVANQNEEKEDEQVLTSNVEPTDALVSASDQQVTEVVPMLAMKEEPVPILNSSPVKTESPIEDGNHENQDEPLPISSFESKNMVKSESADLDSNTDELVKANGEHSGDVMNGNVGCSDESNDSKSVVISRIH